MDPTKGEEEMEEEVLFHRVMEAIHEKIAHLPDEDRRELVLQFTVEFLREKHKELQIEEDPEYINIWEVGKKVQTEFRTRQDVRDEIARIERAYNKPKSAINAFGKALQIESIDHPTLTHQLQSLILAQGWSLSALGELSGIAPSVLSRFMSGETTLTLEVADRLVKTLRLTLTPDTGILIRKAIVRDRRKKPPK